MSKINDATMEQWDSATYNAMYKGKPVRPTQQELTFAEHVNAKRFDPVTKPAHYNKGGIEAIDYIKMQLEDEKFVAYCEGNVLKYTHRWRYKNGIEDLKKAQWYLNKMIEELSNGDN